MITPLTRKSWKGLRECCWKKLENLWRNIKSPTELPKRTRIKLTTRNKISRLILTEERFTRLLPSNELVVSKIIPKSMDISKGSWCYLNKEMVWFWLNHTLANLIEKKGLKGFFNSLIIISFSLLYHIKLTLILYYCQIRGSLRKFFIFLINKSRLISHYISWNR